MVLFNLLLMLINTALHNVKQMAKSQDDWEETLIGSYDTTHIALANCLIIRDHIIGDGENDDDVLAPH